ncbi:hypothetical protein DACRYDRAFT_23480, partial [Dacryopinax primogenitus]
MSSTNGRKGGYHALVRHSLPSSMSSHPFRHVKTAHLPCAHSTSSAPGRAEQSTPGSSPISKGIGHPPPAHLFGLNRTLTHSQPCIRKPVLGAEHAICPCEHEGGSKDGSWGDCGDWMLSATG